MREVGFEKGQRVARGTLLARVGDDMAEAQLAQAKADLIAAEANYTKISKLFERQAVPQQDLIAATSRRDRNVALVRESELRLERALIHAPIAGELVDDPVEVGEVIAPATRVATIQQVNRLKIEAGVPDTEIAWLEKGRAASVSVDAWEGRSFPAKVRFIAPIADAELRTFKVELELDNADRALRPGMVARVSLIKRHYDAATVIPLDAAVTREDGEFIFLLEECVAHERRVEFAAREGELGLLRETLPSGTWLVVDGHRNLVEGQRVAWEGCR